MPNQDFLQKYLSVKLGRPRVKAMTPGAWKQITSRRMNRRLFPNGALGFEDGDVRGLRNDGRGFLPIAFLAFGMMGLPLAAIVLSHPYLPGGIVAMFLNVSLVGLGILLFAIHLFRQATTLVVDPISREIRITLGKRGSTSTVVKSWESVRFHLDRYYDGAFAKVPRGFTLSLSEVNGEPGLRAWLESTSDYAGLLNDYRWISAGMPPRLVDSTLEEVELQKGETISLSNAPFPDYPASAPVVRWIDELGPSRRWRLAIHVDVDPREQEIHVQHPGGLKAKVDRFAFKDLCAIQLLTFVAYDSESTEYTGHQLNFVTRLPEPHRVAIGSSQDHAEILATAKQLSEAIRIPIIESRPRRC